MSRKANFPEFYKVDKDYVPSTKSELADKLMEKLEHQMKKMKYYREKYVPYQKWSLYSQHQWSVWAVVQVLLSRLFKIILKGNILDEYGVVWSASREGHRFIEKSDNNSPIPLFHLVCPEKLYALPHIEHNIVEHQGIYELKKG